MKKLQSLFWTFILVTIAAHAQHEDAIKYANTITKDDLYGHLSILSSDALEGRETGKRGQRMAAAYIRAHFEELGLEGPLKGKYFQEISLVSSSPGETYVMINGQKKLNGKGTLFMGNKNTNGKVSLPVVFGGDASDIKSMDLQGKAVVLFVSGGFKVIGERINEASGQGASLVLIVNAENQQSFNKQVGEWKRYFMRSSLNFGSKKEEKSGGVFFISPEDAAIIFDTKVEKLNDVVEAQSNGKADTWKKVKGGEISYKVSRAVNEVKTENVLGYLEGTDLKDEVIVISAHYDHIGVNSNGEINNGADDDGSGTSSILEIAEAFIKAKEEGKGPRRSILFLLVTGEEKGLLGSKYYVENPVFPLENTVVDLNIDMIGRVDPKHEENPNYIYLIGSDKLSTELHDLSEKVNETFTQFELDYTFNDENDPNRFYYRSDHWNFAKNNIPVIFYFTGTHEDYHKPTDTIDKIEFDLFTRRTQLVFHTAWVVANRDQRIVIDKIQDEKIESK